MGNRRFVRRKQILELELFAGKEATRLKKLAKTALNSNEKWECLGASHAMKEIKTRLAQLRKNAVVSLRSRSW